MQYREIQANNSQKLHVSKILVYEYKLKIEFDSLQQNLYICIYYLNGI